ncbi:YgiT-type zinc finger protein [Paenibacillus sp. NAIST15-1]|uniref:YgiT-type zinc finger protein n=1 Tax=Paenibacillus sp. NAIST15-1 TaxID=1605994 RepID=UPI00086B1B82|nr:YgiT-type zinc finger protein [Paenibacillus sp. NAIST15-1]GAV11309.1 YgiT-type zinc finger domain protein [Paenibacillus sp. NAIST15-1]
MLEQDKQELINLGKRMFCTECGKREHEFTTINKEETINGKVYTIPNVPVMRCKHCNAIAYPSFAFDHIDEYKEQLNQ